MTIKEIAELCGATHQTILNWVHKLVDNPPKNLEGDPPKNWEGLAIKLQEAEKSGTTPADFTLEETLAIIEAGGNKTLAALLAENAANKNAVVAMQAVIPTLVESCNQIEAALNGRIDKAANAFTQLQTDVDQRIKQIRIDVADLPGQYRHMERLFGN